MARPTDEVTPRDRRLECYRETEPFNAGDGTDCVSPEKLRRAGVDVDEAPLASAAPPLGAGPESAPAESVGLPAGATRTGPAIAELGPKGAAVATGAPAPARIDEPLPRYDGKSPAEIRAEIARTREQMTRTIHALKARITSPRLREQFMESARDATLRRTKEMAERYGSDAMHSTLDFIRDHPIPVAMAAIGLGWLASGMGGGRGAMSSVRGAVSSMSPWGGRSYSPDATEELGGVFNYYPHERNRDDRGAYEGPGIGDASRAPYSAYEGGGRRAAMTGGMPSGGSAREMAASAGQAAEGVRETASRYYEQAKDAASRYYDQARETMSGAADQAKESASGYMEQARRASSRWGGRAGGPSPYQGQYYRTKSGVEHFIQDNPMAVGIGALAVGAVLGMFLRRSRYEDELMGDARDSLLYRARQRGREALHSFREAAEETGHRVMEEFRGGEHAGMRGQGGRMEEQERYGQPERQEQYGQSERQEWQGQPERQEWRGRPGQEGWRHGQQEQRERHGQGGWRQEQRGQYASHEEAQAGRRHGREGMSRQGESWRR